MNRPNWKTCFCPLFLCLCAFASEVPFPAEYRTWTVVKDKMTATDSPAFAVDGGLHHFYANTQALAGYRTGRFPDGAVLVDERLVEGAVRSVAVMVKNAGRYAATGGWGYEVFAGGIRDASAPAQIKARCADCHAKAGDRDSVYSAWNPRLAADYLDARAKAWAEWPPAAATGGTCFSCHTSMTYLLARPVLRATLGESAPTPWETALLNGLRARVEWKDAQQIKPVPLKEPLASQALGVEAIFSALFLNSRPAFDRLWSLQIPDGKNAGSWPWFSLNAEPYEMPESSFYGASLAAIAAGGAEAPEHIAALTAYLRREREGQPLHNRLMLLWAAAKLPAVLPAAERQSLLAEISRKQEPDGGWTIQSLGPWTPRPAAPASEGSSSYATAFVAFVLERGGVHTSDPALQHALSWLRAHQDRQNGSWDAVSMNKQYPAGSMPALFMRDAATAFAAAALAAE
jgi:squalene-hopene/tetraprenyl-beta-curcumene cyclase